MTIILLAVTLVSVAVSCALLAFVVRLTREERLRSEARSAALAEALDAPATATAPSRAPVLAVAPYAVSTVAVYDRVSQFAVDPISPADAFPTELDHGPEDPIASHAMFGGASSQGRPAWHALMIPLAGVLVVALAVAATVAIRHQPVAAATAATAGTDAGTLELVTLGAHRNGAALTISGVVRNSHEGQPHSDLSALISLFDRQGALVSSTTVTLDYPRLQPGDESPFSMTATEAATVARYRVSFRSGSARVPHVDRRETAAGPVQSVSAR